MSSVAQCYALAVAGGYAYFGLQWNSQCWLGSSSVNFAQYGSVAASQCQFQCVTARRLWPITSPLSRTARSMVYATAPRYLARLAPSDENETVALSGALVPGAWVPPLARRSAGPAT